MSLLLDWTPASAARIAELLANPNSVEGFINEACENGSSKSVDKAWNGLHYVLTGSLDGDQPPLCYLLYAPAQMDEDGIYPHGWSEKPEEGFAFILQGFETLKSGIAGIAAKGNGLVIWLY